MRYLRFRRLLVNVAVRRRMFPLKNLRSLSLRYACADLDFANDILFIRRLRRLQKSKNLRSLNIQAHANEAAQRKFLLWTSKNQRSNFLRYACVDLAITNNIIRKAIAVTPEVEKSVEPESIGIRKRGRPKKISTVDLEESAEIFSSVCLC
jgi:hypothetical protein